MQGPVPVPVPTVAGNIPDETFEHLFYSCPSVKIVIAEFFLRFTGWNPANEVVTKNFIFTGTAPNTDQKNFFISVLSIVFNYYIWQCKLQKRLPAPAALYNEIFYTMENIRRTSTTLRQDMQLNLPLCRNWNDEAAQRS
jgi:hypothetical protein